MKNGTDVYGISFDNTVTIFNTDGHDCNTKAGSSEEILLNVEWDYKVVVFVWVVVRCIETLLIILT